MFIHLGMTETSISLTIQTQVERVGSLQFDNLHDGLTTIEALGSYSLRLQDSSPEVARAAIRVQGLIASALKQPDTQWPYTFTLEREQCTHAWGGLTKVGDETDLESLALYGAAKMFLDDYNVVREDSSKAA